jgi:hypothetical protein
MFIFHIIIDTAKACDPGSTLNFVEFISKDLIIVRFEMYAIVVIPDKLKILYLKLHRSSSEGWKTNSLCDTCFDEFKEMLLPIIGNCSFGL